jgi:hypothetical protein
MQIDDVLGVILQAQSIHGQLFFQMFLFLIKRAPFLFNIGKDNQKKKKHLKSMKYFPTTHTKTFSSNVILAPKFMKFEGMSLTNVFLL